MVIQNPLASRPLVEIVDILGNHPFQDAHGFEFGERKMSGIRGGAGKVPEQRNPGQSLLPVLFGVFFEPFIAPVSPFLRLGITSPYSGWASEIWNPGFRRDPRAGQGHGRLASDQVFSSPLDAIAHGLPFFISDRGVGPFVDDQTKDIRPRIVTGHIEIESAAGDFAEIEIGI